MATSVVVVSWDLGNRMWNNRGELHLARDSIGKEAGGGWRRLEEAREAGGGWKRQEGLRSHVLSLFLVTSKLVCNCS